MVVMNIAKRINNRLDHILELRAEMRKMDAEIDNDQILNNVITGEKTNKEDVVCLPFFDAKRNNILYSTPKRMLRMCLTIYIYVYIHTCIF